MCLTPKHPFRDAVHVSKSDFCLARAIARRRAVPFSYSMRTSRATSMYSVVVFMVNAPPTIPRFPCASNLFYSVWHLFLLTAGNGRAWSRAQSRKTPMKTEKQINEMLNTATDAADEPKLHGMTYEEGVRNALEWVLGNMGDESPLE